MGGACICIYDTYMSHYIKLVLPPPQTGAVLIPMIGIDLRGWFFTRGPSGGFHNVDTNPSILMKEVTNGTVCKRSSLLNFGLVCYRPLLLFSAIAIKNLFVKPKNTCIPVSHADFQLFVFSNLVFLNLGLRFLIILFYKHTRQGKDYSIV